MKAVIAAGVVTSLVVGVTAAGSAPNIKNDQGRRLAGPFCIGKHFLDSGVDVNIRPTAGPGRILRARAILRAGVVRSIAQKDKCRPWEDRKSRFGSTPYTRPKRASRPSGS